MQYPCDNDCVGVGRYIFGSDIGRDFNGPIRDDLDSGDGFPFAKVGDKDRIPRKANLPG